MTYRCDLKTYARGTPLLQQLARGLELCVGHLQASIRDRFEGLDNDSRVWVVRQVVVFV